LASFIIIAVHAEEVLREEMSRDAQTSEVVIVLMGVWVLQKVIRPFCSRPQDKRKRRRDEESSSVRISIAIPSLFGKPSNPTIPLETLQREQPLRKIENSGWR
jgi:hypothetical protein